MRLPLVLALAAALVLLSSSVEAKQTNNTGGGLRKKNNNSNKAQRTLQNNNNRASIICASSGGVASSGIVPTAPSYQDCYLNGCPGQRASRCRDSNDCGTGSCCMPTSIYGEFSLEFRVRSRVWSLVRKFDICWNIYLFCSAYTPLITNSLSFLYIISPSSHYQGSYCVEVEPLYGLNKYVAPKCRCRRGQASEAAAGDALIEDGLTTVIGFGGSGNGSGGSDVDEGDNSNNKLLPQEQPQPQPQPPKPELRPEEAPDQPTFPLGGGTSAASANANVVPTSQTTTSISTAAATTTQTPATPMSMSMPVPIRSCDGCAIDGTCLPTNAQWTLDDGCTRCTCRNGSGWGDYRCTRAGCNSGNAVSTTVSRPQVEEKPKPQVVEETPQPQVEEEMPRPNPPPAVEQLSSNMEGSDDVMEEPMPEVIQQQPATKPQQPEPAAQQPPRQPEPAAQPQQPPPAQFPFGGGSPNNDPQPQPQPQVQNQPQPQQQPEPILVEEEEEEELELLPEPEPEPATVISTPTNPNTNTNANQNSAGQFGIDQTTPYGEDGKIVCQASGGVTNRGSIPTIANYEECYGG